MKGIFNKALVIALLVSVCGIRAEVADMSGKQLLQAAAVKLSEEGKVAVQAGFNVVKNSKAVSAVTRQAHAVSAKMAPLVAKHAEAVKSAGRALSAQATKVSELSKPVLAKALAYAVRRKDAIKDFCVKNPELVVVTLYVAYVGCLGYMIYKNYAERFARYNELCNIITEGERDLSESERAEYDILEERYG
jgi:hypothetical protein